MTPAQSDDAPKAQTGPDRGPAIRRAGLVILYLFFIALAQALLNVTAIVQAAATIIRGEPLAPLTGFGRSLALWLGAATGFVTSATDEMPFPLGPWPTAD